MFAAGSNTAQDGAAVKAGQRVPVGEGFAWRGDCCLEVVCGVCEASAALHGPGMAAGAQRERGASLSQEPPNPQPLQQHSKSSKHFWPCLDTRGLAKGRLPPAACRGWAKPDGFLFWEQRPPGASCPARSGGAGAASGTFPHPHSQSPGGHLGPMLPDLGGVLTSDQEADRSLVCRLGALGADGSPLTHPRKLCQHIPESSRRTPSQAPGPGTSWPQNSRPRGVCVTCKRPQVAEQRTTWQRVIQPGP